MHIIQTDNRRVAKARQYVRLCQECVQTYSDDRPIMFMWLHRLEKANIRFSWYFDQQSARIARRMGMKWFAGVPASYAVEK